jgi:hypothetical protein
MADRSETLSDNFNNNDSSEVNTPSALLSAINTEADVGSISTTGSCTTPILRLSSSIHKTLLYNNERRKDPN